MAAALGLLAVAGVLARTDAVHDPFDPASAQTDGLLGLVRTLEANGVSIDVSLDPPSDMSTSAFVPVDRLGARREAWQAWVDRGGHLVVADPGSPLHALEAVGSRFVDAVGQTSRAPACPALAAVETVTHAGWDGYVVPRDGGATCFPLDDDVAWLVTRPAGAGTIVAIGSPAPFANAVLGRDDNAVLAAALLAPAAGDRLVIVPRGEVGQGGSELLDLVPPRVWHGLGLLGLAAVLAAVAAGRRLGPPVAERLPPVLPASELAHSLAGLLQRTGRPADAAATLRRHARRRVAAATVGGADLRHEDLVALAVDRLGLDPDIAAAALLDRAVPDDAALLVVQAAVRTVVTHQRDVGP
ncbi:MAG TPA: DUF4350 domain-containing protein [Egicoccus sp.]|nr:DUF4350 domain-containing protein [Egicoccus sp.]HSK24535.1 DUF4350 domain-containing protein [Egicoccus sp.]